MQSRVPEPIYSDTLWRSSTWENWREILKIEKREAEGRWKDAERERDRLSFGTWATVAVLFCGRGNVPDTTSPSLLGKSFILFLLAPSVEPVAPLKNTQIRAGVFSFTALNLTSARRPSVSGERAGSSVTVSLWHMMGLLQVSRLFVLFAQKNLKFLPVEFHRRSSEVG